MTDPDRQLVRAVTRYSRAADDVEPPIRLQLARAEPDPQRRSGVVGWHFQVRRRNVPHFHPGALGGCDNGGRRSEERRVGKEGVIRVDLGGRRFIKKKKTLKKINEYI